MEVFSDVTIQCGKMFFFNSYKWFKAKQPNKVTRKHTTISGNKQTAITLCLLNTKAAVWRYFGFEPGCSGIPKNFDSPICKYENCATAVPAKFGNTTNLYNHIEKHHPSLALPPLSHMRRGSAIHRSYELQKYCSPIRLQRSRGT